MKIVREAFLPDTILSSGLAIAFYCSIAGHACVWFFRRELFTSAHNVVFKSLLPLLGAVHAEVPVST